VAAKPDAKARARDKAPPLDGKEATDGEVAAADAAPAALGPGQIRTPNLVGENMADALAKLAEVGLRPMFLGTGVAVEQIPAPGEPIDAGGFVQINFLPVSADPLAGGDDGASL
jgi:hypothetical protein